MAIIPGTSAIEVICANEGTIGEKVLREISNPDGGDGGSSRNKRSFDGWQSQDGSQSCKGSVRRVDGSVVKLKLVIGDRGEETGSVLQLEERPASTRFSTKPIKKSGDREFSIPVGTEVSSIRGVANQIVAAWVGHGYGWTNGIGEKIENPYETSYVFVDREEIDPPPRGGPASILDRFAGEVEICELGALFERSDIYSSAGPFSSCPEYTVLYPKVIVEGLADLYAEYNEVFASLIEKNREWRTDYQYCRPANFAVQIDMIGLPSNFLSAIAGRSEEEVREILRRGIYEIENSIAMYQLLERLFSGEGHDSRFKCGWRAALNSLRRKHGMPIALLAVTEQKHRAMLATEFGKDFNEPITDEEVEYLSGFDRFFGPDEFQDYLQSNGGRCDYLLFARTSDPVTKLQNPEIDVEHPLLSDPGIRKVIKANAVTLNVDDPEAEYGEMINDTKEYQPPMGLGFSIGSAMDISSSNRKFVEYLAVQGVEKDPVFLRGKPAKGTYGCYGHVRGLMDSGKFRSDLESNIRTRGPYVIQPEMPMALVQGKERTYAYIDRIFFAYVGEMPTFIGGFRNMMPVGSSEVKKGRVHGNKQAVWAEIIN